MEMASHPEPRTTLAPAFYNSQADIAYGLKAKPHINATSTIKIYALVIVCSLTTAVDILVIESLRTQEVVAAIMRHSSRYGLPSSIRVDNGSNLVSLQSAQFQTQDLDLSLSRQAGIRIDVSAAKAHESNGRVERKIRDIRKNLSTLMLESIRPITPLQWQTALSLIAAQLNNIPLAA